MRTTIDLPEDVHRRVISIARDTSRTLSQTVTDLLRRGLEEGQPERIAVSDRTGLPVIHVGTVITTEDVRALEDNE